MSELINRIICGSVPKVLKQFPQESIDCVVTSPPYWALRDYGVEPQVWDGDEKCEHEWETRTYQIGNSAGNKNRKQPFFTQRHNVNEQYKASMPTADFCIKCQAWRGQLGLEPDFDLYIKHLVDIFSEIKRVLRKDGTCWVNLGDTYSGNMGKRNGWTDNKLGFERQEAIDKGVCLTNKTKFLYSTPDKSLCLIPFRFAIEMVNRGWILRNTIIWHKPNCMPSSIKDRFTVDFEYVFFFVKSKKYWFETQYEKQSENTHSRYSKEVENGSVEVPKMKGNSKELNRPGYKDYRYYTPKTFLGQGRNKRAVWTITTKPFKEAHFAVFPETLVEPMIKAGCPEFVCKKCGRAQIKQYKNISGSFNYRVRDAEKKSLSCPQFKATQEEIERYKKEKPDHHIHAIRKESIISCNCNAGFDGGIVLDPFCGSGTTLLTAKKLGRSYIGIDIKPEYVKMSKRRIAG